MNVGRALREYDAQVERGAACRLRQQCRQIGSRLASTGGAGDDNSSQRRESVLRLIEQRSANGLDREIDAATACYFENGVGQVRCPIVNDGFEAALEQQMAFGW